MKYENFENTADVILEEKTTKELVADLYDILRENVVPIIAILSVSIIITIYYLNTAENIYRSTTLLKIEEMGGGGLFGDKDLGGFQTQTSKSISDRILFLESFAFRDRVSEALHDTLTKSTFSFGFPLLSRAEEEGAEPKILNRRQIRSKLRVVTVEQRDGLSAIEISVEGKEFNELSLISNLYANEYIEYLNEVSKQDLKSLKKFLEFEIENKTAQLKANEAETQEFLIENGIIDVNSYFSNLFSQIYALEKSQVELNFEIASTQRNLDSLEVYMKTVDNETLALVETELNRTSLLEIQKQINTLKIQEEFDLILAEDDEVREQLKEKYAPRLKILNRLRDKQLDESVNNLTVNSYLDKKELTIRIIESKNQLDQARLRKAFFEEQYEKLSEQINNFQTVNARLNELQRQRGSIDKLYGLLVEKYQETEILERTRIGSGYILDPGWERRAPVRPDKLKIFVFGISIGFILSFGFAFIRSFFDKSIKSPEIIDKKGASLLAWIPSMEVHTKEAKNRLDKIVLENPKATASESFKALRTRIHFARLDAENFQTILITSSIPSEGKTTVAVNLAASFAQTEKKVLLLDCDLRKPRIHNAFGVDKQPGLTDYLFGNATLEEIEHPTTMSNFNFIASGTIPPNPSEILGSKQMQEVLETLKKRYDLVVIDSPPFVAVTDSEILFNITDGAVLVARANTTPIDLMMKTYTQLYSINHNKLLGAVLNDFSAKSSYGSYYSYYYYYAKSEK